jgi:O-antigen ligase
VVICIAVTFGFVTGFSASLVTGWSLYRLLFVFFALLLFPALIVVAGNVARALLVAVVFAMPLNFSLSPFYSGPIYSGGTPPEIILYLYDFPLIGLVVLWFLELITKRKTIPKSGILFAAFFWILWTALSIYNSENFRLSFFELFRMVKLFIFMLVISTLVRDKHDIRMIYIAFLLSLIFQSLICMVQYLTGTFFNVFEVAYTGDLARVSGTMDWPNTAGAYLATLTSIAFILFISNGDKRLNLLSLSAVFAGFISLILTYSRGAWIALLTALMIGILIARSKKRLGSAEIIRLASIVLVIIAIIVPFIQDIIERLNQIYPTQGALADRISLMIIARDMIIAHPIFGVGVNTFVEVMRYYDTTGLSYSFPYPVHDIYLQIASETGLVGLGLFLVFVVKIFKEFYQVAKSSDSFISPFAIALMSGAIAILVSNLFDVHLKVDTIFALFWFLAGVGMALPGLKQSPPISKPFLGDS